MNPYNFYQGELPLLVSFPHSGTWIPNEIVETMTVAGKQVPDTDWFLPRLYDSDLLKKCSRIEANFSRYVIDPNRPPDDENLYPGQPTPKLCPLETFAGEPIYEDQPELLPFEVAKRKRDFWQPYHDQILAELVRLASDFGYAILFDAHSIKSQVPRLFEGQLPDFNIGTANSSTCPEVLENSIVQIVSSNPNYSHVVNGRFIGGYITRHYGTSSPDISAVQLELSQATYMNEATNEFDEDLAQQVRPALNDLLQTIVDWTGTQ